MNSIDSKYLNNSFILVGHSGYGKSTTCKAFTGNKSIVVSSKHEGCTSKVSYYPGEFKHLFGDKYFTMIDTPGLDDSEGRDKEFYQNLRDNLQTKNLKVKGIIIVFNLQMTRFGQSEKKIIEKIIDLVPVKNLWKYITILVTHSYYKKPEKLVKKKEEFIKDLKEIFENNYIHNSFFKYGIIGNFKDIKIAFADYDDEDPQMNEAGDLQKIMENSFKREPLFQECKIEIKENIPVIEYSSIDNKTASLYKCKIKYIKYYGQGGKILNEIKTVLDKKKEKDIKRSELDPNDAFISGGIFGAIGLISLAGLAFPPLEIVAALGYVGSVTACAISEVVGLSKVGINAYINSDFKNDELREFLDESN